ncbi:hypothetical protein IO368_000364 [Campylobacter upsaliensis]|nr:hypothetical protein [Campylobacter upsaliensis]
MQFNFNFEAFEQSGKEKNEAINYLKSLNSSIDFDKLEQETKGDENAIYEALKGGNFSFSKPSIEQTRQKLLKNKENEALKAEFNAGLSWLGEEKKQNFNFYDFKKAKEKANSKQGLIEADLKAKEKELKRKEALFETRLKERGIIAKSFDDMLDQSGAYLGADLLEKGLNKLGFKDENYIFESEKEDIKSRALKSVREKLERGDLEFNEREKHALRSKYDELDYKKALEKEKERLRLSQKSGNFSEAEREFIENDLGFFNTLFNDDKENIKEFKEKVKSEGVISSEIIKAANTLKAFDEGNLFKNMLFADEKEKKEFQQNFLNDAYKIAELSGFDDVGLDKKGELYFIKDEQKYLVNTGFFDNFAQLLNDTKFEFAGGVLGGLKGFNSGKSAKGKVAKSILGAAAGSFGGAFLDAKIADMYLNRESDFKKNLDFAIQAGLLSMAGDGVILSVKPLAKGLYKGVKKGGEILGEYSILGTLKTLPEQNIQAAEKIIDEVFSPKMKEELKAAQEEFGGSVRGEDLKNAFFANLQKKFTQKYGENDSKTKSVAKIAEIFNTNSLKTRQQAMLDLVRSDKDGSTLAYLLEIAKDDVKIQSNLKNMLNLASSNVEKNLKNLNINAREIKHILDEFEAGNKAAFKEVESQIARLYDENYRVVLSKGEYENIKEEFRQNGVNLEEMTPFLRDLEANVFNENGVTFTQLNNFRKNLNFYIYNRDKTPNFINTLKKIGENILKNEIDKGIDNIFSQNKAAYESIKELYSTSLKDYATLKSLNESIKNLKLQDSAKSADEVLNSLIKYAKGQGEKGVNNLQKIKDYLGEENNAFLEMQILNKLFKESVVENDRASLRVFDSESFLGRVRELVGENELYERKIGKEFLEELSPSAMPKQISIDEFLNTLENFKNKENFLKHIEKDPKRKDYLNLIEPTLKEPDIAFKKLENGVEKEKFIKKFSDGKDFFYLLATKDNKETILTAFKTDKINTILKEFNADIIPTFIRQGSKGKAAGTTNEGIITQPLFKSKEAREFLELVEGFHKLYKNDASIAKNLVQGTASQLSTSIATSAEGAIKQKVVKGAFDPIFRLLPDKILFGLFAKQIQGGALRYHLKKALSRSLNYDDFKIKLEKELKRTNFNSNTSRLIDEFMQNLDTFNAEKEAKLAKIREEQARIKEEERKRAEEIYQAQEANNLKDILEAEEKPLKDEFGVNFEGFKGKEAIEKLLEEQRGQVKGAFYKEGLGEIDLVWGEITDLEKHKGYGLAHILDKRKSEFVEQGASESEAAQKAAEFAKNEISNIMQNGKIINKANEATRIETQDYRLILKQNWKGEPTKNKWLVTAYMKKEKGESISSSPFTKEDNLSLNSKESIAQKALNLHEKLYLKDNDTPLNVEYKIVNKDDIKPSFTLSKTQFRSQKQEDLIKKIKENFNPDLLVNIRGDLKKGNPIITKEGEVISGNHRAAALKELEGENLAKYQNAVKEAFGVELKENEMLVRVADTSEAEIRRFSAASNEGLENNLGEQGVSLFAKYQDKIKALKEAKKPFVADDVYNLKYLVNKALGESSITKENDTSKALFASLAKGRNNTILKALNELEKENLEQVNKVANMFFDNAGAFYNLTHDLDLPKMQNLQNYFSDVLVSAAKADFTRAEDFARLNEDIRAFLDSGDKNAMLKLSPNLVSDLLAKAMGAGFARFARLENPSASLYEFLNGLKAELIEKGMPDLFSGGKGIKLNERDEFDFAKELILKGQDSEEKFRLYQNLEELKAWSGEQKNTKLNTALKALDEVDESKLSEDQKELLRLFKGEIKSVKIQIKDLKDIYTLNQGSRKEGAKKILIKHYGEEKTGGLSSDELLSLKEVIKKGKINLNSLEIKDDFLRYGYDYEKDGVKLRVVIDEFKDGKKVFDYYSDRNFNHYEQGGYKPDLPTPSEIIPQNAKTSPYPQNSQEAKIKEAVKNHNAIYKEILDNDYIFTDERSKIFRKRERELIENLAKDEKVQAFTSQWGYPFKKDGELRGIGLNYKAKVYGKGEHKMMYVDGGGFGSEAFQKKKERLLELEKERLQEAFKADFGIDGFISKYVENDFFETLWGETRAYKGTDYGWGVDPREYYPYYENRIMPSDTITQAKEKLQKEKSNWSVKRQEAKGSEDIIFTDKKGKEHTLTKETQKAWLEAFNLKSLDEEFIPNLPRELKEALGKEIKLTKGSLYKIVEKGREKYIPQMKQTLQNPDFALRDRDNMLILAKQIEDKQYFTSVNLETKDYFISVSNAPKKENILKNKVENGAEILYQSPNAKSIFYTDTLLQTDKSSANKIDEDIIAQNAKSERAEFESFKDKIKELYTKYEGLSPYDKSESQLRIKLLDEEIEPEIKKEFKNIIDKFKGADNKDKILRVIKENKEELSDYLAFHIALRKDIDIDGHGEGKVDFYDKSIRDFIKFRENKQWSEIDESKYRALAALENLSNKNTSLYFSFKDLNGKIGEFKTYPRIQDLLFYDLILGYDLKNAVILSTKDKHLKEKLIEKLKAYIDKKIYADFLEYKIKDLESRNPKNSHFENYKDEKWDEEALKSFKKELEDLRANEKGTKLEAKGSEDIIFTDKKGKEHTLTKETQKAWLEAFGLKSLDEAYIPNFKAEVKEAINRVLGGEEIKLTKGSYEKLLKRDREEFLPYIKDTLEKANAVIKQVDGALIFAKDYRNERLGKFFASVSRNDEGEWIITSNAPKNLNNLKNKLNEGGELLYSDLPELTIIAKPDLDANALNSEANLKDIIPQKANLEAVNKQKDKEFLEAYEKADFKGKVELAKQDINEEIKFLEKQKEEFERITQQKDYNDIELEQARKILENAKEEVEGHYRIKYMQNGKEMRAYISKTDYFNQGKILSKDEILHKIIQKTIYKDKIENIKKTSDKLKKQIKIIDEYLKEYGDNEAGAISDDIIEKFKYYDFAKNAGKGAVIIGERRKGLYEQAQKVLNSRLLKAKKRSAQSKKNYNITYDEARKLFYKGDMSEEQKELFQSVLPIAQKLNVRIRTAIREPYEDMIKDTTNIAGMYRYELNTATLKKGGNYTDTQRAETLLHELIHSVTSRAMSLYKTPLRDKMLSKTQIKAIDEIDQIYKKLYKFKKTFKLQDENGSDLYGIKNSHEMLAELANPMFSSKLKEIGLYEKLVNNIMKIILSVRDFIRLRSDKNVYEKLKQCLKDIIENYKDDFTQEYEKQNIRDFTLTSQTQKEQIYTQRQEIKNTLKAKINQAITNENTGEKAILTNKGISKMLSDKAISKSVDNGFSREEHLRAVGVVDELFKRAKRAFSKRDEKDKNLSIYRYNAPFKNANALMTLKEYKQNGKRIYSLELENLEAAKFNPSGKDLAEQLSKSKDADTTTFHTPIDNPDESIAQKSDNIYHSNPHLGAGLVGGVLNGVEQDENGNLSFDPVKFAMGFLGGSVGSFALKKGFQILEKNPELKEKIINELAHTLAQGFEKAREKYSLLNLLEPRYIVKNEKGRKIQAKTMLKELEREQNKNLQNIIRQNLQNLPLNNKPLELSEKQVKLLINRFANARNLKEHLNTRADNRKELYALLNDTLENPQIHFIKEGRDKYVKRYKGDVNEPYFYLLITQDKDKIFITHLKTRDIKYLSRQISNAEQIKKGADIIEALSQRAGDDKASASKKDYSK